MTNHRFDAAIALKPDSAERELFHGGTSPDYGNMVGPFGGTTAATLLQAVLDSPEVLGSPVSLTVNFAAPLADGPFTIATRPVRTNRSNQHWLLELQQDAVPVVTGSLVTGLRRETWADTEVRPPEVAAPEELTPQQPPDGIAWAANYDIRFAQGALPTPGSGESADSTTTLWVRDDPPRQLDFPGLAARCDVFFPRVFLRHGQYVPAGTVSMTAYFHADADTVARQAADHVLGTARAQRFGNGYFDQTAELWGRDGSLLATTHQIVYFKA